MDSLARRSRIQAVLTTSTKPISASQLAKKLHVSRQTVVGDVALLRAEGEAIVATLKGYEYEEQYQHKAILVCRHFPSDTADEMTRIVKAGGTIIDVVVTHPLYGQLKGMLQIKTVADVNLFIAKLKEQRGHLLSELTDGVHTHTIAYEKPEQLAAIQATLREAGYLYE